jgi:hypothetical protein
MLTIPAELHDSVTALSPESVPHPSLAYPG